MSRKRSCVRRGRHVLNTDFFHGFETAHNITDGLAMAASFYASPQLGAISTVATFMHEIPHEVSDEWKKKGWLSVSWRNT